MFIRLRNAAIAFALTAALYQAYAAVVVPMVEPPTLAAADVEPAAFDLTASDGREQFAIYRPLLEAYFPPNHWCFAHPPKMFDNGRAMIVLDEYQQNDAGRLVVPRCAVIFFPKGRAGVADAPRDAIVMEPASGATLQLDRKIGGAGFGKLQFGQLLGEVVVRSDMNKPGPEDDLRIVTRDVFINEDLISTAEPVDLRLGKHVARGRSLEIRFLPAQQSQDAPTAWYGKLDTLEVSHDVAVSIDPATFNAGNEAKKQAEPGAAGAAARETFGDAPIHIDCTGPFTIDFGNELATFADNVRVQQVHPDGQLDELTAKQLTLYFDAEDKFAPATIEADGTPQTPVVLDAPAHGATARCEKMRIELKPQRVTFEGVESVDGVALTYQGAEVHAPMVRYTFPPRESGAKVGTLDIRGGAGRLRAIVNSPQPGDAVEVTWKDALRLVRRDGQPVLLLDGRPTVDMVGVGKLYADAIELFLSERRPEEAEPKNAAKIAALPQAVVPQRITASGGVNIESAELNGRVNQLEVKFSYPLPLVAEATRPGGAPVVAQQSPPPAALPFGARRGGLPLHTYDISGIVLKLGATVRDGRAALSSIRVDGGVVFQEESPQLAAEPPLKITAEHLKITKADTPNAEIDLRGAGGEDGLPVQLVEINSRGMTLAAPAILIHRGTNRAWINSPGTLAIMLSQDMSGKPLAQPQPLNVAWQEALELNDNRITFRGDVRAEHAAGWLRTNRLVAQLTSPVNFAGGVGGQKPQLAQLECWEGAVAEYDQRDVMGVVVSHQHLELQSLLVNQVNGQIAGDGPGKIDSVHLAKSGGGLAGFGDAENIEAAEAASPVPSGPPELRHLHIDFARGVTGNLLQRNVRVLGDVRTVYGPVARWEDRLTMTLGGSPPPGVVWISCDELGVTESPLSQVQATPLERRGSLGPVELDAAGRVVIELIHPEKGAFTLRGGHATYDQAKTMFVLAGDTRGPATVTNQPTPGSQASEQSAQKLIYIQSTGIVSIKGVDKIQWNELDMGRKPASTPAPAIR